ncbi:MAG: DUF1499 domain-containing protein [Gemmatimonadetes bacterium]|nr:DUF1499 domain-containing protein [Gemmatimonadota bacterium]
MTRRGPAVMLIALLGCAGPTPDNLGPRDGTLAPCPGTPNCVHTGMRHPDGTVGMYLTGNETGPELMAQLEAVVESMTRTTVVESASGYLRAEAKSFVFRFVDDLELLVGVDGELIVRSASRVGEGDLGVNARRVAELRKRLQEAGLIR